MLAFFAKLVPFRDYAYAALAVAAVCFWFYHDHVIATQAVAHERAAVQAESTRVEKDAETRIEAINNQHIVELAKVKETYDNAITASNDQHTADLQRLRDSAARREGNAVLDRPAGSGSSDASGPGSAVGLGTVPAELAVNLADALRKDDAALNACYADRDSLTGK